MIQSAKEKIRKKRDSRILLFQIGFNVCKMTETRLSLPLKWKAHAKYTTLIHNGSIHDVQGIVYDF